MPIPKEAGLDHTIDFIREGYLFISNRQHSFHADMFETRLLGQRAVCMGGKEAAELFYDTEKFKRQGAAPNRLRETLFGENSVLVLDDDAHKNRKQMFMSLMTKESLNKMNEITREQWEIAIDQWTTMDKVVLYEEAKEIMCRTACQWAGVPLFAHELQQRTNDLAAMFESPAAIGRKHWKGRKARNRTERWLGGLVEQVRSGKLIPEEGTALHVFSMHRDLDGNLLDTQTAAVELVNILRPITATSLYITFCALALHHHPNARDGLQSDDDEKYRLFVQEVRRFYPFLPATVARVKNDFNWKGHPFKKGTLTFLDFYGTNHDPELWKQPNLFIPDRFKEWEGSPFDFIPQGGGDYIMGHRCAGEWVTIRVMKECLHYLVNKVNYRIPEQDLSFSMVKMPSIPHSKVVMEDVEWKKHS